MRTLKPTFILMALEKELKLHDWYNPSPVQQDRIKTMVEDAYNEKIDPSRVFYENCPVEKCDDPERYGIKITWEEAIDNVAMEFEKESSIQ